jgi:hypothetical protein
VIGYGMNVFRAKKFSVTIMAVLLAVIAYKKAVYRLDDKLDQVRSPQHTQRGTSRLIASRPHCYSLVKGIQGDVSSIMWKGQASPSRPHTCLGVSVLQHAADGSSWDTAMEYVHWTHGTTDNNTTCIDTAGSPSDPTQVGLDLLTFSS